MSSSELLERFLYDDEQTEIINTRFRCQNFLSNFSTIQALNNKLSTTMQSGIKKMIKILDAFQNRSSAIT
jgi:hypothetical protein